MAAILAVTVLAQRRFDEKVIEVAIDSTKERTVDARISNVDSVGVDLLLQPLGTHLPLYMLVVTTDNPLCPFVFAVDIVIGFLVGLTFAFFAADGQLQIGLDAVGDFVMLGDAELRQVSNIALIVNSDGHPSGRV